VRGAQKCKKDSQVVSLFTLLGSAHAKGARKYVGEIDPAVSKIFKFSFQLTPLEENANAETTFMVLDVSGNGQMSGETEVVEKFEHQQQQQQQQQQQMIETDPDLIVADKTR